MIAGDISINGVSVIYWEAVNIGDLLGTTFYEVKARGRDDFGKAYTLEFQISSSSKGLANLSYKIMKEISNISYRE